MGTLSPAATTVMRYPIMVEAFNGVHLRPMLESVMSTKLRSVSWGTSNELKSKWERQRHTEAKERQRRKKQCSSLLTSTELWKQLRWYAQFLLGFGGKGRILVGWFLLCFCFCWFPFVFLDLPFNAVSSCFPGQTEAETPIPSEAETPVLFTHTIFKEPYMRHLTCNKLTLSNDSPQRPIIFWQKQQKKHSPFFFLQVNYKRAKFTKV